MNDEQAVIEAAMQKFEALRNKSGVGWTDSLARYLKIIPDPFIKGFAQQKLRDYFRKFPEKKNLSEKEIELLSQQIVALVLNEIIQKARSKSKTVDEARDGAELFYRRALNCIGTDRYKDAESFLRRAVEICPSFLEGWKVLVDVYEHTGKAELAFKAKIVIRELEQSL